ncbi:PREDICTED: tetratricopeptide repeat protein 19, mitochondrial isoform X2 [Gekko japonicus]|uniref:Tetratricopeptide repeat protein 19, mitochondrial isoform X2 n=1 Tax=Gekko japonicus TaxID=146911 RepID=A0ABM1KUZ5_GEKJA|nr:PREDICTED: tetratricopeptide repeat protein 19, mitochondrial isoform X2 [Gekko japonicus]
MSLWALLRRLPRTKLAVAPLLAASGRGFCRRHLHAQERPRPHGGATPIAFGLVLSASSLFSQEAEEETEKDATESLLEEAEEEIIFLLKKAKLCIMKGELEEAERLLHEAARLSHQSNNRNGIIYTYDTMANLAFLRGQLDHAEKLFKAAMTFLLAGNMEQDDNAIIEMSLKLASIYAAQNQEKLALAGYQFCILTLKEKIAKQKDMAADAVPEEERINTRLLLGMSLDSYARYLLARKQAAAAERMYEEALQISMEVQGETHPQTVVLMNDLATALDAQGRYDDAYTRVRRALDLARQTEHPEAYVVLNNLAGILMHKEDFPQARQVYKEALKLAEEAGDGAVVRYIRKELAELARRQKQAKSAENLAKQGNEGKD